MNKRLFKGLILLSLITLTACTDSEETDSTEPVDEENNSEQMSSQVQYILPQSFSVQSVSIETDSQEVLLDYKENNWEATGLENPDPDSIALLVEELLNIVGKPVEEEFVGETTLTLYGSDESIEVIVAGKETANLIQVDEQVFEVEDLPLTLDPFNPVFLEDSLELGIEGLNEISFEHDGETVRLSQSTDLNEVEKLPFISGWYLNDVYETAFSIEYYWMNTIISQLTELKAVHTDAVSEAYTQKITLRNGESEEILHIGENSEGGNTLVYLENQDQTIAMPTQVAQLFQFEPLEIVDNFIALIPLDAVETVNLSTPEEDYTIQVERTVDVTDDDTEISSTFYFNDEEIEESIFRRTYQYLARLSYSEPLTPEEKQQTDGEDAIELTYDYLLEGKTVKKEIRLVSLENSKEYSVVNDGIVEFKMTDEKLEELFDAFDELKN